jgi:hypothetical protein
MLANPYSTVINNEGAKGWYNYGIIPLYYSTITRPITLRIFLPSGYYNK